jgi:uncharacterized protein (DUF433 family)
MDWREYITSDPQILFGKPVITGTRIPVDLLLEKLAAGNSRKEILEAYPKLTPEGIQACLQYNVRKYSNCY